MNRKNHKYKVGDIINNSEVIELITHKDSRGSNIKAYKMRCLESNGIYEVKQFNLSNGHKSPYVSGQKVNEYNWLYNEKHLLPYLKNKQDAKKYTKGTAKKITCVCPSCSREKDVPVKSLVKHGFTCQYCKNSKSYPELFMQSYLKYFNIKYDYQVRILDNRFIDFYLPDYNMFIETNGEQHYKDTGWKYSYERTKESDEIKREYCKEKGITLLEIDCSKSDFNYIVNSINKVMGEFNLPIIKEKDEMELKSLINKEKLNNDIESRILELCEQGLSHRKIERELNLCSGRVRLILKKYGLYKSNKPHKKVKCLNNNITYNSLAEAQRQTGANVNQIRKSCNDSKYSAGTINGEKGKWCFVN